MIFGRGKNMKKERNDLKITFYIWVIILLIVTAFLPLGLSDFILPPSGGGMIHSDLQLSDNIRLPVPTTNVGELWYNNNFGGEIFGTYGLGIAGNGNIAASTFNSPFGNNLIIYDYYGNRLWSSGLWCWPNSTQNPWSLNPSACGSAPMIDIHDRVVACDYQRLILVNASNHSNINVDWVSYFPGGLTATNGVPLSPTIVEKRTIIVPTSKGPLFAYNVTNGQKLATLEFWDNSSGVSFYAVPEMNWSDFLTIISNPLSSPYHYNSTSQEIEWNSEVEYGIMPLPTVFFEGLIIFVTDRSGVVAAIDLINKSILAIDSLGTPELITMGGKQYATINSACVKGNRVYITTQFPAPNLLCRYDGNISGRLYAVDVNPDAENTSDILTEAWNFSFSGQSQASPILINDTIFFDAFNGNFTAVFGSNRDPRIYAVYTNGTLRWKRDYENVTGFSFSMDPRGGFWYNDMGSLIHGGGGKKLVHFPEENESILEEIIISELINESGALPLSTMTICGNTTDPIMIVSAVQPFDEPFGEGRWVIAINLSDNNSLL